MSKKNQSNTAPTTGKALEDAMNSIENFKGSLAKIPAVLTSATTGRTFHPLRVRPGQPTAWVKIGDKSIAIDGRIAGKGEVSLLQLCFTRSGRNALVKINCLSIEANKAVKAAIEEYAKIPEDQLADRGRNIMYQQARNTLIVEIQQVGKGTPLFERTRELLGKQYDKVGTIGQIKAPTDGNPLLGLKDLHLATPEMSGYLMSPESGRDGRRMMPVSPDRQRMHDERMAIITGTLNGGFDINSVNNRMTVNPKFVEASINGVTKFTGHCQGDFRESMFAMQMFYAIDTSPAAVFAGAAEHFDKKARKAGKKIKITK